MGYDFKGGQIFGFSIDSCIGPCNSVVLMRCLWFHPIGDKPPKTDCTMQNLRVGSQKPRRNHVYKD